MLVATAIYTSFCKGTVVIFKQIYDECRHNFKEVLVDDCNYLHRSCLCCIVWTHFDDKFCSWNFNSNHIYASGNLPFPLHLFHCFVILWLLKFTYLLFFQYLSNQIKDEVPASKIEMAEAHDHRFVLSYSRMYCSWLVGCLAQFWSSILSSRHSVDVLCFLLLPKTCQCVISFSGLSILLTI